MNEIFIISCRCLIGIAIGNLEALKWCLLGTYAHFGGIIITTYLCVVKPKNIFDMEENVSQSSMAVAANGDKEMKQVFVTDRLFDLIMNYRCDEDYLSYMKSSLLDVVCSVIDDAGENDKMSSEQLRMLIAISDLNEIITEFGKI